MIPRRENTEPLTLEQKVKKMRKERNITQYELADALATNQARISRIEKGYDKYTKREIEIIKKLLGIEGMPLTEFEFTSFKMRLHHWLGIIRAGRMDEAAKLREELSNVVNIEVYDEELPMLFRLFEVSYLLTERNFEAAEEKLQMLANSLRTMSNECLYYYNSRMGSLYAMRNKHENALTYFEKAFEISEHNKDIPPIDFEKLYYNMAICYTSLERMSHAIVFLNKISRSKFEDDTTNHSLGVDITLAVNYYKIGMYNEAEKILNNCLVRANSTDNKFFEGLALQNLGVMHMYKEEWEKAIKYFEKTLDIFDIGSYYHAWALYLKIRCEVKVSKLFDLERELIDIMESPLKEYDVYSIFLKTLLHTIHLNRNMTRYNMNAVEYIENIAIPHFIENSSRFEALDLYELLERHYLRTNKLKQSLKGNREMLEIRMRMV